jgi:hypothetical protein
VIYTRSPKGGGGGTVVGVVGGLCKALTISYGIGHRRNYFLEQEMKRTWRKKKQFSSRFTFREISITRLKSLPFVLKKQLSEELEETTFRGTGLFVLRHSQLRVAKPMHTMPTSQAIGKTKWKFRRLSSFFRHKLYQRRKPEQTHFFYRRCGEI